MRRAAARVFAGLLDSVKGAQPRISRRRKDHISAFPDLRQRNLFALTWIVPGRVGHTHVVLNDPNVWVGGFRALLVTALKAMNQANIHPADEADSVGLRSHPRDQTHQIRTFVLFEDQ